MMKKLEIIDKYGNAVLSTTIDLGDDFMCVYDVPLQVKITSVELREVTDDERKIT